MRKVRRSGRAERPHLRSVVKISRTPNGYDVRSADAPTHRRRRQGGTADERADAAAACVKISRTPNGYDVKISGRTTTTAAEAVERWLGPKARRARRASSRLPWQRWRATTTASARRQRRASPALPSSSACAGVGSRWSTMSSTSSSSPAGGASEAQTGGGRGRGRRRSEGHGAATPRIPGRALQEPGRPDGGADSARRAACVAIGKGEVSMRYWRVGGDAPTEARRQRPRRRSAAAAEPNGTWRRFRGTPGPVWRAINN